MTSFDRAAVQRLIERDLVEWAEDIDLRLVWADLLQLRNDPLGRLVVLDHLVHTAEAGQRKRLRAAAEALRERLAPRLWTSKSEEIRADPSVTLHWELGFVRELEINASKLKLRRTRGGYRRERGRIKRGETVTWMLCVLLREPALRFVESVRIDIPDSEVSLACDWVSVGGLGASCLREVHVGRPARARARPSGQWEPKGSQGGYGRAPTGEALATNFRRLRRFSYAGELLRIHCCGGASQTREHHVKRLPSRPLTSPNRASLARSLWDASSVVHQAGFAAARELGPQADFLLDELEWFLHPPLSRKDPRPALAFEVLGAIGAASAELLPQVLEDAEELLKKNDARREALLRWLIALGPRAKAGLPLVEQTLARERAGWEPKTLRATARRARASIMK